MTVPVTQDEISDALGAPAEYTSKTTECTFMVS